MIDSTFDRLVSELSEGQRDDMLQKLTSSVSKPVGDIESAISEDDESYMDISERIRGLGLLSRLWLLIRSVFRGDTQEELYEADLLSSIARRVAKNNSDLIDPVRREALPPLYRRFRDLEQSVRTCFQIVGPATSQHKGAFLAFLLEMESEEIHLRLQTDLDPEQLLSRNTDITDVDMKRTLESNLVEILDNMPTAVRNRMYVNAQFLENFRRLGTLDFARVFSRFHASRSEEVERCELSSLRDILEELSSICDGLKVGASENLVRSLYMFVRQQSAGESEEQRDSDFEVRLETFAKAFSDVRRFFATTPILSLTRLASNSIHFRPERQGGGEDWYAKLKQFWQSRVDAIYQRFAFRRRQAALLHEATEVCDGEVGPLEGIVSELPGQRGRFSLLLGIIDAFLTRVFRAELQGYLRTLQINGDFYKESNQKQFTDAFEQLRELSTRMHDLRGRVGPNGTIGKRLKEISEKERDVERVVEQRKPLVQEIDNMASTITSDTINALRSIILVLNGILYGEVGGEYDTLSNLSVIQGRETDSFLQKLDKTLICLKSAEQLISRGHDLATVQKL